MSAPHVTGAVALLRSLRPDLGSDGVRRLLRLSAEDLGAPGHDPRFGAGLLDLPQLLEAELPAVELAIESPGPGEVLDPGEGPLSLRLVASGADLVFWTLAVSPGLATSDFEEIARGATSAADEPLSWAADDREDGPHVLRLRGHLRDGRAVDEYQVVGLERNRPLRLSMGALDETQPSISGRRVVWRASTGLATTASEVRAGVFGPHGGAASTVVLAASDDTLVAPTVSGDRAVWLERDASGEREALRGCRLPRRRGRTCQARTLFESDGRIASIDFRRDRVLWSSLVDEVGRVLGCLWRGGRACRPTSIADEPASGSPPPRRLLDFDGHTALWVRAGAGGGLEICPNVLDGPACTPRFVTIDGATPLSAVRASLDDTLLAFEVDRVTTGFLAHCRLDLETGLCRTPQIVAAPGRATDPDVSGRRIVWSEAIPSEPSAIAFCEVDPFDGSCDRQRLTGAPRPADDPKIEGHRVVWVDGRDGPAHVFGLELPMLRVPFDVRARAGRRGFVPILAADPAGGRLQLALEGWAGPSPEALRASIVPLGGRWAALVFEVPPDVGEGVAQWRIRGVGQGGLETATAIEIPIVLERSRSGVGPPKRVPGRRAR